MWPKTQKRLTPETKEKRVSAIYRYFHPDFDQIGQLDFLRIRIDFNWYNAYYFHIE